MRARRALAGLGSVALGAAGSARVRSSRADERPPRQVLMWGDRKSLPSLPEGANPLTPVRIPWFEEQGLRWQSLHFGPTGGAAVADGELYLWTGGGEAERVPLKDREGRPVRIVDVQFSRLRVVLLDTAGRVFTFPVDSKTRELEPMSGLPKAGWLSGEKVAKFAVGPTHAAILTTAGRLFGAGSNSCGQLGASPPEVEDEWGIPVPKGAEDWSKAVLIDGGKVSHVAVGREHTVYVRRDPHSTWACGNDTKIQLALGDTRHASVEMRGQADLTTDPKDAPVAKENPVTYNYYEAHAQFAPVATIPPQVVNRAEPLPPADFVACGDEHTVFAHRDSPEWVMASQVSNVLFCCGENFEAQCGRNRGNQQQALMPVRLPKRVLTTALKCGSNHCVAGLSTGETYAWGYNVCGQVGNGNRASQDRPRRISLSDGADLCGDEAGFKAVVLSAEYNATGMIREKM